MRGKGKELMSVRIERGCRFRERVQSVRKGLSIPECEKAAVELLP
jgi:hypothetical protein